MKNYIFTITTGGSGTVFLKELLKQNFDFPVYHERVEIDDKIDWGIQTPEISHLVEYNNVGNTDRVQKFWTRKLGLIYYEANDWYAETSHVLANAGLIENVVKDKNAKVKIIILKRDPFEIVTSLHKGASFINLSNMILWWLSPWYKKNMISLQKYGPYVPVIEKTGQALLHYITKCWYVHEVFLRAEYFRQKYGDKINFVEVDIEDLNYKKNVKKLFKDLGLKKDNVTVPKPQNTSSRILKVGPKDEEFYKVILDNTTPDYKKEAEKVLNKEANNGSC